MTESHVAARVAAHNASMVVTEVELAMVEANEAVAKFKERMATIEASLAASAAANPSLSNETLRKAWIASELQGVEGYAAMKKDADDLQGKSRRLDVHASEARRLFQIALTTFQKTGPNDG